jgi:uncharacterized damage-inducible protein DinB
MRELLTDTLAHIPPARALEHLTPREAECRVPGTNHSIAEIVAHLTFWMQWFCERCDGVAAPMAATAADGWPAIEPDSWPAVHDEFLRTLERVTALADGRRLDTPLAPTIEFPPLAAYTTRDALVHMAVHNAHHLGQIVVLRQLMGVWPPPSGGWTW